MERVSVKEVSKNVFEVCGSGPSEHDDALAAAGEYVAELHGDGDYSSAKWTDESRESVTVRL